MKKSEKVSLLALTIACLVTGGLWWALPGMHWGVYLGFGVLVFAGGYAEGLKLAAHEKLADQESTTDRK